MTWEIQLLSRSLSSYCDHSRKGHGLLWGPWLYSPQFMTHQQSQGVRALVLTPKTLIISLGVLAGGKRSHNILNTTLSPRPWGPRPLLSHILQKVVGHMPLGTHWLWAEFSTKNADHLPTSAQLAFPWCTHVNGPLGLASGGAPCSLVIHQAGHCTPSPPQALCVIKDISRLCQVGSPRKKFLHLLHRSPVLTSEVGSTSIWSNGFPSKL